MWSGRGFKKKGEVREDGEMLSGETSRLILRLVSRVHEIFGEVIQATD
jgi:hypothetical protein